MYLSGVAESDGNLRLRHFSSRPTRSESGGKRERESSVIGMDYGRNQFWERKSKVWDMEKEVETLGKEMMLEENSGGFEIVCLLDLGLLKSSILLFYFSLYF